MRCPDICGDKNVVVAIATHAFTTLSKVHIMPTIHWPLALVAVFFSALAGAVERSYPVAPTGQRTCHNTTGAVMACRARVGPLAGQDAAFATQELRYRDNGDGTVSDLTTGLMWQQVLPAKVTWAQARAGAGDGAAALALAGHTDWRLPTLKELYSLMDFSGSTPMPGRSGKAFLSPLFSFRYGDASAGERPIDVQFWSATPYVGRAMNRRDMIFGVNFADGRIKAYPSVKPGGGEQRLFVRYVRGDSRYGQNQFRANGDGTLTDHATGLMWMQEDSGHLKAGPSRDGRMDWPQALAWAQGLSYAGHTDWRLPNAKELQSIVDYQRSPQTTGSAAIDPLFKATAIVDEGGQSNYGFYWSSTSHFDGARPGSAAVYVAFGDALGFMRFPRSGTQPTLIDVHGAGAQRSDPKVGNAADYPTGMGPQGDVRRMANLVRLVREVK